MGKIESKAYAVVIGLDNPTGLQTARILKARRVPVIGVAKNLDHYCCRTNSCERLLPANIDSEELIEALSEFGSTLDQRAVLFPCTDISVMNVSKHRAKLSEWYHVVLANAEIIEMLIDKLNFYQYAQANQLPIPKTWFVSSVEETKSNKDSMIFPCIIKPPYRPEKWKANLKQKAFIVQSPEELLERVSQLFEYVDTLIIQQVIEGPDRNHITGNCYFDRSNQVQAVYTSRKIRQWPRKTGEASCSESEIDPVVVDTMLTLFSGVGYYGLGYLEMKIDQDSGKYYIIEPNIGRPTGRSAAAEASGVELVFTMYCDALGLPLPEKRQQAVRGSKWIFLQRDLQSAFSSIRDGTLTIGAWLRSLRGRKVFAVYSLSDPLPFVYSLVSILGQLTKKAF